MIEFPWHTPTSSTLPSAEILWIQGWTKCMFCALRAGTVTRQITYLDGCFSIWILSSASFLAQQWWPTATPILGVLGGNINTGFYFSLRGKMRCFPLFPFQLSLALQTGGHGQQPICGQVCWHTWRRESVPLSPAWPGQSLCTRPGF